MFSQQFYRNLFSRKKRTDFFLWILITARQGGRACTRPRSRSPFNWARRGKFRPFTPEKPVRPLIWQHPSSDQVLPGKINSYRCDMNMEWKIDGLLTERIAHVSGGLIGSCVSHRGPVPTTSSRGGRHPRPGWCRSCSWRRRRRGAAGRRRARPESRRGAGGCA